MTTIPQLFFMFLAVLKIQNWVFYTICIHCLRLVSIGKSPCNTSPRILLGRLLSDKVTYRPEWPPLLNLSFMSSWKVSDHVIVAKQAQLLKYVGSWRREHMRAQYCWVISIILSHGKDKNHFVCSDRIDWKLFPRLVFTLSVEIYSCTGIIKVFENQDCSIINSVHHFDI